MLTHFNTQYYDCASLYRWQWWTTFYAFTVLVLLTAAIATGFVCAARSALIALLAINVLLQMEQCNTFFYLREVVTRYGYTDLLYRGRVYFAGCVVQAGIGFSFILALGTGVFVWGAGAGDDGFHVVTATHAHPRPPTPTHAHPRPPTPTSRYRANPRAHLSVARQA